MEQYNIIIGSHPVMRAIVAAVERLAVSDKPVLITGEKGTGKGLIARRLHARSARAEWPFVHVDCGTGSSERLERELFGFGADLPPSAWQRAAGGVLLLDELTALPVELQRRLATRLSTSSAGAAPGESARVIGTARHDLADGLGSGYLDEVLVYCLEAIEIPLPSLRQRRADIPILVEHFLETYVARHGLPPCRIETDALVHLWQYDWPGNVRELESVIERVVVLCRNNVIRTADLPSHIYGGKPRAAATGKATPINGSSAPILRPTI